MHTQRQMFFRPGTARIERYRSGARTGLLILLLVGMVRGTALATGPTIDDPVPASSAPLSTKSNDLDDAPAVAPDAALPVRQVAPPHASTASRTEPTEPFNVPLTSHAVSDSKRPLPVSAAKANAPISSITGKVLPSARQAESGASDLLRTASVLIGVVALIFIVGAIAKKLTPAAGILGALGARGKAPSGVLEVLARYPAGRSTLLILLKLDRRVLLVSQQTGRGASSMSTLTEITDANEVASILAKVGVQSGNSPSRAFASVLGKADADGDSTVAPTAAQTRPSSPAPARTPAPGKGTLRAAAQPRPPASNSPLGPLMDADGAAAAQHLRTRLSAMRSPSAPGALLSEVAA